MHCVQNLPADMPAARRDLEIKSRKDESKLQQSEAVTEFVRRQHEFAETDIRKVQRSQLLQMGQLEQKHSQEVRSRCSVLLWIVIILRSYLICQIWIWIGFSETFHSVDSRIQFWCGFTRN